MTQITTEEIEQRVSELGQWFHNLDLHGVKTAPHHFLGDYPNIKWRGFAHASPAGPARPDRARHRLQRRILLHGNEAPRRRSRRRHRLR